MELLLEVYGTVNWSETGESHSMRASLKEKLHEIDPLLHQGPGPSSHGPFRARMLFFIAFPTAEGNGETQ